MLTPRVAALLVTGLCTLASATAYGQTPATSTTPVAVQGTPAIARDTPDVVRQAQPLLLIEPLYRRRPANPQHRIVLAAGLGVLDHATTGTLADYGYDRGSAPSVSLNARWLSRIDGCSCAMGHGVDVQATMSRGPSFGLLHGAAYTQYLGDVAYAFRVELPCLRSGTRRIYTTGMAGMAVLVSDAGTGDASPDDTSRWNERTLAASAYDRVALGWRIGGSFDITWSRTLVGIGLDLRNLYAVSGDQARTLLLSASLRVGFDIGL